MADRWPDIHKILMVVLEDLANEVMGPRLKPEFTTLLPVIRVRKIGGRPVDRITAVPRVAVDVYAVGYATAEPLAETVCQRLLDAPHITPVGNIDRCEVEVVPFELPYADPEIRNFTAVYALSTRR